MKIIPSILFYSSIAMLIIGVHQTLLNGWHNSYWLFMFSIMFFFVYKLAINKEKTSKASSKKPKKRRKR